MVECPPLVEDVVTSRIVLLLLQEVLLAVSVAEDGGLALAGAILAVNSRWGLSAAVEGHGSWSEPDGNVRVLVLLNLEAQAVVVVCDVLLGLGVCALSIHLRDALGGAARVQRWLLLPMAQRAHLRQRVAH